MRKVESKSFRIHRIYDMSGTLFYFTTPGRIKDIEKLLLDLYTNHPFFKLLNDSNQIKYREVFNLTQIEDNHFSYRLLARSYDILPSTLKFKHNLEVNVSGYYEEN